MGHYWREMDPVGAAEHDKRIARELKLRKQLKGVKLSKFTVGELEAVMRLFGLAYNGAGTLEPREEHFKLLEKKVGTRKRKSK